MPRHSTNIKSGYTEASPVLTAHGTHTLGPGATNCLWSHETRRSYRDMRTKRLWTAQHGATKELILANLH